MKRKILKILTGERPLIDVWHYLVGNYRYYFYYGGKLSRKYALVAVLRKMVIREHIKEQIAYRIDNMNKGCYENGECELCGCATTALQMAFKSCENPCYPEMMDKYHWEHFRTGGTKVDKHGVWIFMDKENKHVLYVAGHNGYEKAKLKTDVSETIT